MTGPAELEPEPSFGAPSLGSGEAVLVDVGSGAVVPLGELGEPSPVAVATAVVPAVYAVEIKVSMDVMKEESGVSKYLLGRCGKRNDQGHKNTDDLHDW
jgi:hypothetical protein